MGFAKDRYPMATIKRDVGQIKENKNNGFKCEVVEYRTSSLFNNYDKAIKLSKGGHEITLDLATFEKIVAWAKG